MRVLPLLLAAHVATGFISPLAVEIHHPATRSSNVALFASSIEAAFGQPTELPDSLEDGAEIAAASTAAFYEASGVASRCRVDFDTSAGDETFTLLKSSTEFMQKFVSALCYALIPKLMEQRQTEMMRLSQAKAELKVLIDKEESETLTEEEEAQKQSWMDVIKSGGADSPWEGPKARIYFPDEGNAALARRDWLATEPLVPSCVEFSSCGGVQNQDITKDMLVFFFCPKASESDAVEELLLAAETKSENLKLCVFVNPVLVDMGVTGFGMAGRMLRERLIDNLTCTYYLRTLLWGALTRSWPRAYSVWQEDENANGGYRLISTQDRLPSNPEVEDIYDVENGLRDGPQEGLGLLNALGDFVNGMMKL